MIKLIKSTFYKEKKTKEKLIDFIRSAEKLSMGDQVHKFEEKFSKKQKRKFSVFVNSGSSANLLLIQSLLNSGYLRKGDKVGFSALTWPTNVMPIIQLGLEPIPIDCEIETLNVSSKKLKNKIDDLDAFFLTNTLGFAHDPNKIKELCDNNNVIFIEDNAESLGSVFKGNLLGNFGLASTFSFFVGHHISTIEGGMICTDDEDLYRSLLIARSHGWDRHLDKNNRLDLREDFNISNFYGRYSFYDLGYNVRSTEINGFIGNLQIDYWNEIVEKRFNNFKEFQETEKNNEEIIDIKLKGFDKVSNFAMPVILKNKSLFKKYKNRFENNDVEIRPIIAGDMTKQPFYKKYVDDDSFCDNADFIHKNGFYFGNNPELTEKEIEKLKSLLKK